MVLHLICLLLLIVMILQSVAFLTLWERHVFGLTQNRLGPNKVVFSGLIQPLLDGVKLLKKELVLVLHSNWILMIIVPSISFLLLMMEWLVIPFSFMILSFNMKLLFFLVVMGCSVYPLILAGIVSKSKFGLIGSLRAKGQTVSFEVLFSLFLMSVVLFYSSMMIESVFNTVLLIFFFLFLITILVELNRAPFDFSEGESELVSGYNVEFSSVGFVLFFLKEYGSLIFFSVLMSVLFTGFSIIMMMVIMGLILYVRSSFPRFRYDLLMKLFWFTLLPLVINLLILLVFILD